MATVKMVGDLYINFASGRIAGNCEGCTAADVADALVRVARELRMMDETPFYIAYDEGKISSG